MEEEHQDYQMKQSNYSKPEMKDSKTGYEICIQGLSFSAYGPDIRKLFDNCGKIVKLKVPTDNQKKSKGIAFATFEKK